MTTETNSFVSTVEEDENGDAIIPFPEGFLERLGWLDGDELEYHTEGSDIVLINVSWQARQK